MFNCQQNEDHVMKFDIFIFSIFEIPSQTQNGTNPIGHELLIKMTVDHGVDHNLTARKGYYSYLSLDRDSSILASQHRTKHCILLHS